MGIQLILWIVALVVLAGLCWWAGHDFELHPKEAIVVALWVAVCLILIPCIGSVPSGSRGIVYQWGKISDNILQEGVYFIKPISEHVTLVNIREQKEVFEKVSAQSKDGQEEFMTVTVNFQLRPDMVHDTYRNIGSDWKNVVLFSPIQEAIRVATTRYDAFDAASQRTNIAYDAQKTLQARLDEKNAGVTIKIVTIDNIDFSPAFNATMDNLAKLAMDRKAEEIKVATVKAQGEQTVAKATADANAIRQKANGDADAKIAAASAEAKANELISKSLTPNVITWRQMAINEIVATKWQGTVPQTMLSGQSYLPVFNIAP